MLGHKLFRTLRPYVSALAVIATAAILVFTIYFTRLSLQWTAFLTGVLVAAILAEATRVSRAEWTVMRRTAQLSSVKDKLEHEAYLHQKAEEKIAADKSRLHLLDEVLQTMVVLVDSAGHCRYHNRAFREWLHLRPEQIDSRHLREIMGPKLFEDIEPDLQKSLLGKPLRYERMLTMQSGGVYHLSLEQVPQFAEDGKVTGVYLLADDITEQSDVLTAGAAPAPVVDSAPEAETGTASQDLFIDLMSEQLTGQKDAAEHITEAIEKNEFRLFYQLISPLTTGSGESRHYEVLIRLLEEEENMMPPGAFFPLAEKHGLMSHLDQWVVKHVLEWASRPHHEQMLDQGSMFFLNLAQNTLRDPGFPAFVGDALRQYGVPASILCFEIPSSELAMHGREIAHFIQAVRAHGCRAALSGFGRDMVTFNLIRGFQVEYLKIDGSIILNMTRDPVDQSKVAAISRVAQKIGVKTIAEFVESEEAKAKLREIGVDFAQGFGISKPHSFEE